MKDTEKLAALIRLAIDPRTPQGEAEASLAALRRLQLSPEEVAGVLGGSKQPRRVEIVERMPEFLNPAMPFGKHKGKRLADLAKDDPGYLHWLLSNCELKSFLETQIRLALRPS